MTDLEALNLLIATGDKVTSARLDYLQQTLGINKLFLSEEFNQLKQGLRYLRDNSFDPSTADLSEFLNESDNPFVRESELPIPEKLHIISLVNFWNHNTSANNFLRTNPASGGFNAPSINNVNIGSQTITITDIANNASFFITQEAMILKKFSFEKIRASGSNRQYFVSVKAYQRSSNGSVINVIDVADINADFGSLQTGAGFFSTIPTEIVIPANYMVTLFIRRGELSTGFDVTANLTLYFTTYVS
jgi:hypothetical protein